MMLQDPPAPPAPPDIPQIIVGGSGMPGGDEVLFAIVVICLLIGAVFILGPIARAFARRLEGRAIDPAMQDELLSLRDRVGEFDQLRDRMLELEERVDFAERMLARPADARPALPAQEPQR